MVRVQNTSAAPYRINAFLPFVDILFGAQDMFWQSSSAPAKMSDILLLIYEIRLKWALKQKFFLLFSHSDWFLYVFLCIHMSYTEWLWENLEKCRLNVPLYPTRYFYKGNDVQWCAIKCQRAILLDFFHFNMIWLVEIDKKHLDTCQNCLNVQYNVVLRR